MTAFETQPNLENQEMPELKIDLKDVPESSPQAFNQALRENVAQATRGLTDYLNQNRQKALGATSLTKFFGSKYHGEDGARIDDFIRNIESTSDALLQALELHQDKPIEEQRALLRDACFAFDMEIGRHYGVMQSFIPYNLGNTREVVEQGIVNPITGYKGKRAYRPPVKREYSDPEQANADKILDGLS